MMSRTCVAAGASKTGKPRGANARRSSAKPIKHLDKYLLQFEEKVIARGGHVFWAANGDEACAYIKDLAVSRGVKTVVKSKSMVTEEIHLAPVAGRDRHQGLGDRPGRVHRAASQ